MSAQGVQLASPASESLRRTLSIGFFGTSIMEHFEGYSRVLVDQANLPKVGSMVTVESWRRAGYVHRLHLGLQAAWPHIAFDVDNRAEGGATSRDVAGNIRTAESEGSRFDLAFASCGINDVWRGYQGRAAEAVGKEEFSRLYAEMLDRLRRAAHMIVCLSETPFGPLDGASAETVGAMNRDLASYNRLAARAASDAGAVMLDVWTPFTLAARHLPGQGLWSDGVHLSELGDALMVGLVQAYLREQRVIESLVADNSPPGG